MSKPKLSKESEWLLRVLNHRPFIATTVVYPQPTNMRMGMGNLRGLERRGWAKEVKPGLWEITDAGITAVKALPKNPEFESDYRPEDAAH